MAERQRHAAWLAGIVAFIAMFSVVLVAPSVASAVAAQPYQVLVRPADASNPLSTNHTFTVELRTDVDADGAVDDPVIGEAVRIFWAGPAGSEIESVNEAAPDGSGTCVTRADVTAPNGGTCTVEVSSPPDVGVGTLTAVFDIPGASVGVPEFRPTGDQGTTCNGAYVNGPVIQDCDAWADVLRIRVTGDHTWVGYVVDVEPDAVMPVNVSHTFDLDIDRSDGINPTPASGVGGNFTWINGPLNSEVTAVTIPPVAAQDPDCTADAGGICTVTVVSPTPGTGTLRFDSVVGALIGSQTKVESPTPSSDLLAIATWVDWRVVITPPEDTNFVGDDHVFLLTLEKDDGTGWAAESAGNQIITSWVGPTDSAITAVSDGTITSPAAADCTTDALGRCRITVSSSRIGPGTLSATEIEVSLPGYIPPSETIAGAPFAFDTDDVQGLKTWVEFFANVAPSATNLVGDPHSFTIEASYDDGDGITDLPDGSTVQYSWSGTGTAAPPAACTISAGSCTVIVSSDDAGTGVITVQTVSAEINGVPFMFAPAASAQGGSLVATKTWIQVLAGVGPSAVNLVGDPHVFTIDATYDNGVGIAPVPNGSTVSYTWTGTGTSTPPASCVTTAGSCDVTVTSATTGVGTIVVTSITTTINGTTFAGATPMAAAGESLTATKTWADYQITITPATDQNLVDNDHVFTVTVLRDLGDGFVPFAGATPKVTRTGVGVIASETCSDGTLPNGTCTVITISEVPGDMAVTATLTATAAGSATLTISDTGDKLWVNYRLTLTPKQAINEVNDPHVFVAKLEVDRGDGFRTASNQTLGISSTGIGAIIGIDPAGPSAGTCVTDGAGTCRITVNSAEQGTLVLTAEYQATVGSTTGTFAAEATKGWIVIDLPETGSDSMGIVQTASGLAAAGLGLLLLARRRRSLSAI